MVLDIVDARLDRCTTLQIDVFRTDAEDERAPFGRRARFRPSKTLGSP